MHDELDRCFEVVEEPMNIGKQNGYIAASSEELCYLNGRYEIAAMGTACSSTACYTRSES